jgi:hypothetical protein
MRRQDDRQPGVGRRGLGAVHRPIRSPDASWHPLSAPEARARGIHPRCGGRERGTD